MENLSLMSSHRELARYFFCVSSSVLNCVFVANSVYYTCTFSSNYSLQIDHPVCLLVVSSVGMGP